MKLIPLFKLSASCKTARVARLRGRDWISLGICCVAILISSNEVVGGPSTPPAQASNSAESQHELSESSPLVSEIKIKRHDSNIEVFVEGWRPSPCHKSQEILVSPGADSTRVVIRMKKSAPGPNQNCNAKPEPLNLKVADLNPASKSSYKIQVLGHKGWHVLDVTHLMPQGL